MDRTLAHLVEKLSTIEKQNMEIIKELHAMDADANKVDKKREKQEMETREQGLDTKEEYVSQQGHHIYQAEEVRDPYTVK